MLGMACYGRSCRSRPGRRLLSDGARGVGTERGGAVRRFSSIGHVAIRVSDVERTLAFYRDKLGFAEMLRLHREDGRLWLLYLRITDEQYLEVFPEAVGEKAPGAEGNGLNHVCLTVDDLDDVVRQLGERGVALMRRVKLGPDGNRQAWIEDPDGNRIELMEMAADGLQAKAIERLRRGESSVQAAPDSRRP
jgi:lactoylglutathione lyase